MTWDEVAEKVLPRDHGQVSTGDWTRARTAMRRLSEVMQERGVRPEDFMGVGGVDALAPMLEDPKLRPIAEWVILRTTEATKGVDLPAVDVIPGVAPAPVKVKKAKSKKQVKVEVEDETPEEEEDTDMMDGSEREEFDEEQEELPPEEEIEEARTPRKQSQRVVERVIVQQAPRRAPKRQGGAQQPRRGFDDLLPPPQRIRVFMRLQDGTRQHVNDYTYDDIGEMPVKDFLEQYIDPEFGSPDGPTRYEVYKLDAITGREKPPMHPFTIGANKSYQQPQLDPFSQVQRAHELIKTLRQPEEPLSPMLQAAQQKAVASGDISSLMMLMMMERMMKPQQNEEMLLKVMDRLDRMSGAKASGADFGPPAMPPMPFMMPPPPPMPPPAPPAESKLMDMLLAKTVNQPSTIDTLKELAALQQFMGGGQNPMMAQLLSTVQALAGEVAQLKSGGIAKSGLEDAVATFEKVGTMVKALAPQVGGAGSESAGLGSALQNIITPKLGAALGDALAGGLEKQKAAGAPMQGSTQAPTQGAMQPSAPATQPPPRDPNRPPNPVPQAVRDAAMAIGVAQTHAVRVERFIDFIQAMFTSGDPYYAKVLQPALEGLNEAEKGVEKLTPARTLAYYLALEVAQPHASPDFADEAIETLAKRFGVAQLPPTFTKTRGLWLLDARGQLVWKSGTPPVVLIDGSIAVPMPTEPPAPPAPQPPPPPAPSPVEPKQLVEHTGWDVVEPPRPAAEAVINGTSNASNVIPLTVEAPNAPTPTVPAR